METFAEMVGVTDFGSVRDGVRVKDDDIGNGPDLDATTVWDAEGVGGQAGHFADGLFEQEGSIASNVSSEHSSVVPEASGVGHGLPELSRASIARNHGHGV